MHVEDSYETPNDHTTLQVTSAATQIILALIVFSINSVVLSEYNELKDKYENAKYNAKFSLQFLARSMGYASPIIVS